MNIRRIGLIILLILLVIPISFATSFYEATCILTGGNFSQGQCNLPQLVQPAPDITLVLLFILLIILWIILRSRKR